MRVFIFLLFTLVACNKKQTQTKLVGEVFGTTYGIIYNSDVNHKASIDSIYQVINHSLSTYQENSIISKINRNEPTKLDAHFKNVYQESVNINNQTHGFFDPTVGELVKAWGFKKDSLNVLSDSKVEQLMVNVGLHKTKIEENILVKENPNIILDFNAIAKGYALDVVGDFLYDKGIESYLIEIGGEIVAKGEKAPDIPWKIGIDSPNNTIEDRTFSTTIALKDAAMATSGNYRKFKIDTITGVKYVHTINPKTGVAKASNLLSVSVIAPTCMQADALATAFMAMGKEKTELFLAKTPNIHAYLIYQLEGKPQGFWVNK